MKHPQAIHIHNTIAVVIPCFNEADGIQQVVDAFRHQLPNATILVVDNGSTDETARIAANAGATVITESRRGKGYALYRGFIEVSNAAWVVMVDGDGTYPPETIHAMLDAAHTGADMVVGTRLEEHDSSAFRPGHSMGNRLFAAIVRFLFQRQISDLLSGYRVLSRRFLDDTPLIAQGFEVETELSLQAFVGNFPVAEIPVRYRSRAGQSKSKLRTYRDGTRILLAILAFIRDFRPLTFFGMVAAVLFVLSLSGGSIVVSEYLRTHQVLRLPLAVLSSASFLLASLSAATGIILSSVNRHTSALSMLARRQLRARDPRDATGS